MKSHCMANAFMKNLYKNAHIIQRFIQSHQLYHRQDNKLYILNTSIYSLLNHLPMQHTYCQIPSTRACLNYYSIFLTINTFSFIYTYTSFSIHKMTYHVLHHIFIFPCISFLSYSYKSNINHTCHCLFIHTHISIYTMHPMHHTVHIHFAYTYNLSSYNELM